MFEMYLVYSRKNQIRDIIQMKILPILHLNWIGLCSVLRPLQHSIGYKP